MIAVGIFILSLLCYLLLNVQIGSINQRLTTSELAQNWGYDSEEHEVITEDGYILTIFRIKKKGEHVPLGRKPLLLAHGLAASSDHYLAMEEKPFFLYLLEEGYDTWLCNVRGSRYGKKHKHKPVTDVAFWDFSWHELGVYDLSATIDYIRDKTNNTKVGYAGYSIGSTMLYVLMSKRPEYNDKVAISILLSPAVYFHHTRNIFLDFSASIVPSLLEFAARHEIVSVWSFEGFLLDAVQSICTKAILFPYLCRWIVLILSGLTDDRQSDENARRYTEYKSSMGVKELAHYGQVYESGKFREYKYSTASANLLKYGSEEPPEYNISSARIPIVIFAAHNDTLVAFEDINVLVKAAPNLLLYEKLPFLYFGHTSAVAAKNSPTYLSNKLLPILRKISFV